MGLRVLLVDDQASMRMLLGLHLELEGHQVVGEAGDAKDAVTQAGLLAPEVVVLDQELPHGPGTRILPELRALVPGVRVIVFSADPSVRLTAAGAGADGFLLKGEPLQELTALLK